MTAPDKAPEQAWLHFDEEEWGSPFEGWWHISEGAAGEGLGLYIRADVADAMVAEEIASRDAMGEAFSKAYALAMGRPMEWSSAYNQAEALADMEEQLASDGAEIECKAWNAALDAVLALPKRQEPLGGQTFSYVRAEGIAALKKETQG